MARIPGLTFAKKQSLDRLLYEHDILEQELIQRLLLTMGHPDYITTTTYGVVSENDPAGANASDGDYLAVAENGNSPLTLDINPGMAVFKSGVWCILTDYVRGIALADQSVGINNIVYLQYTLQAGPPTQNKYYQNVSPYYMRIGGPLLSSAPSGPTSESVLVQVDTLDTYLNFAEDILVDTVPLAVATVQSIIDPNTAIETTTLSIDHTRSTYSFNRPWFSTQDVEHRNRLGTGVQSDNNTHALSQDDLTVGDFTPQQLRSDFGFIVAEDKSVPKQPGYRCQVSIPYSSLKTDDGSVVSPAGAITGFANKKYIELESYPTRLGRVWVESTDEELAALHVKETNIVVFASDDPPLNESIGMYYTKVDLCEPPVGNNEINFTTNNALDEEIVFAGGIGHKNLTSTTEEFNDAQRFPMIYELVVDEEGTIIKTPQPIYCYKRITAIGASSTDDITIDQYGPAKLMVGLAEASGNATMSVKVTVSGTDESGAAISHTFEFTGGTWTDPYPLPNITTPTNSVRISDQVFASSTEVKIDEAIDAGPNASIIVWALLTPTNTRDKLKDACHIAETVWDGFRLAEIRDKRVINTTDQSTADMGVDTMAYLTHLTGLGAASTKMFEDFRNPEFHTQIRNEQLANATLANNHPYSNFSKLRPGAYGKYITRAYPVMTGSGGLWRAVLIPKRDAINTVINQPTAPSFYSYTGGAWNAPVSMAPVAGLPFTYEAFVTSTPTRVKLEVVAQELHGLVLFG